MLVRASLISALLLSILSEAAAAERAQSAANDAISGAKLPEKGAKRATTVEDLFGAPVQVNPGVRNPLESESVPAAGPKMIRSGKQRVDESGLRYFASQNQPKRVEKEIERLKALYPDWTPPDDLALGQPGGPEEQPMWDLFAQDKLTEIRTLIAERMKADPKWKPSAGLLYKIERKESRLKLVAAYEAQQWNKVIEVAAADPKIMVCADIDVPWRVSDAFQHLGRKSQAFEVYRFILANCRDKQERLTTLKKAIGFFEPREVDILVAMGARNKDGSQEFDEIRLDLSRIRLGKMAAEGAGAEKIAPAELKFFEATARSQSLSADAAMLGWYRLSQKEAGPAAEWFKLALDWPVQKRDDGAVMEQPAKMAEGYLLALKTLERFDEAEALAVKWSPESETIRALFVDIMSEALVKAPASVSFDADRLSRYEMIAGQGRSALGAQALGWYHFNRQSFAAAVPWFQASMDWSDADKKDIKTAEGLAISLRQDTRADEAEDIAYDWRDKSAGMKALYIDIFSESLIRQSAPLVFAKERMDRYAALIEPERSGQGAEGLAWYAFNRKNWADAARWFKNTIDWTDGGKSNEKFAEGYTLSLRGNGQFAEAEDVAFEWRETSKAMRKLYVETVIEGLGRLPVAEAFAPDRLRRFADLAAADKSSPAAEAIGWYLYSRQSFTDAVSWFQQAMDFGVAPERADKVAEGFILALRYMGDVERAEELAFKESDKSDTLRTVYIEIAAESFTRLKPPATARPERLERFAALTSKTKSSFGAQAIGWYYQQRDNAAAAADWFNRSLAWGGKVTDAKTAQGYLLALISQDRMDEADKLAFEWHEKSEEFRTLYIDVFGGAILRTAPPQQFPEQMLTRFAYITAYAKSVFGSQAVAWYYYDRQDWPNASRWFQASLDWAGPGNHDQKTVEGFAQSIRYLARREEAEDILYAWRDKVPLLRQLYIELFSEALANTSAPVFFSDERISRFANLILTDKNAHGAQGLGWYRLDRRHWPDAVRWFKYAREWSGDGKGTAKDAEGLAFGLRNLDLYDESEFVSVEWKDRSPILRKLYSETVGEYLVRLKPDVAYPNDRMERYLAVVTEDSNNVGAQSAGWYYFARDMFEPAAEWFYASLAWGPDFARDPKTAEGYVESLRRTGRLLDAEAAAYDLRDRSPGLREVYFQIALEVLAQLKPPASFPAERMGEVLTAIAESRSAPGAQAAAWYYSAREDFKEAVAWFERSLEWGGEVSNEKIAEGMFIALVGIGRLEDADRIAMEWFDKSDTFRTLYIDVLGGAIVRATPPQVFPETMLTRYGAFAAQSRSVFGAQAIGWYHSDRRNWEEAARWFQSSLDWAGTGNHDQKTVEGFTQAIRYLARREEAEDILYAWRDRVPLLRQLYTEMFSEALANTSAPVVFSDERINRYVALILNDRNAKGAQGLGWYRLDRRQWPDAVRWFKYAREWSADGKGDAKDAEGLAFALRNLNLYDESEFVSVEWKDRSPIMRKLYSETVGEYLVRMKPEFTYPNDRMERYLAVTSEDSNNIGAQSAGWYYFAREMFAPAADWFYASLAWGPDPVRDPKTAEGYVESLRRTGRLLDAEAAAYDLRDRSPAMREIYFQIATEVIGGLQPPADMPAERLNRFKDMVVETQSAAGAQAIAWYHNAREDWQDSSAWFERAITWGGPVADPKSAEGYLVSLIGLGRLDEADALVRAWLPHNPDIVKIYMDVVGASLLKLTNAQAFPAARLEQFGAYASLFKSGTAAEAMAWYAYNRRNWDDAARWFQSALSWATPGQYDVKSIEGFAQSLRYLGRRDEAEDLLYQWRDHNADLHKLYVETFAEALINQSAPIEFADARINRYAQVVLSDRTSLGAQALAWYRYNRRVWSDAARWFKHARAWSPDGKGDAKMAEGLAFALRNMDLYDESETVSWEWRDQAPAVRKLYIETVAEFIVRLKPRETYPVDRMSRYQLVLTSDKSSIGAQAAGWYYFARDRWSDAVPWFRNALAWGPDHMRDPKTAEGLAIALMNAGQSEEAENFAYSWRERSDRLAQMYYEFAADAMGRLDPSKTYAADRMARLVGLTRTGKNMFAAQNIGWYHIARRQWAEAAEWFKTALDWSGDEKDVKTIEGYTLALRNLERIDEAEAFAFAWKDKSEAISAIYLETVIDTLSKLKPETSYSPERLASFVKLVGDRRSVAGARALGWYRLQRNEDAEAELWFRNANSWSGDDKDLKTVEGLALALRRQQKIDEASVLALEWRGKSDAMRDLYRDSIADLMIKTKAPATLPAERLKDFVDLAKAGRNASAAVSLGWYFYDRKDWAGASQWFKSAMEWETDTRNTKGAEGYVLTLKNTGKLDEAENIAYEWRDRSEAMRALYIDIVPELISKLKPDIAFPNDRLNRFAAQVTAAKSAYGAQALAWYRYERKDQAQAATWFKSALDWAGDAKDPKVAEGYVLSLRGTSQFDLAENVAFEWRDRADAMRSQYIETFAEALTRTNPPPPFSADRLTRYTALVSADKNAIGAQALGWYSYNIKQYRPARAWFEKALQWAPSEGSALGLALAARAMKDVPLYTNVLATYRGTYPKLVELLSPQPGAAPQQVFASTQQPREVVETVEVVTTAGRKQRVTRPSPSAAPIPTSGGKTNTGACIANVEARERSGTASAADMVNKGWCLLNADRPEEAAVAFGRGQNAGGARGEDAAYGRALSLLRAGVTDEAAMTAQGARLSAKRQQDIGSQVLTQKAVAAQRAGQYLDALRYLDQRAAYAPETRDLSMIRGWALYNVGRKDAARRVFTELDRQLSTNETQSALAVVNQIRGN